jgi:hypothetical protein
MSEEPKITMIEFKIVIEDFKSEQKKMSEHILHLDQRLEAEFRSVKGQIALLHEGQTEIKIGLKQKVDREEFSNLEKRVARLESKIA